MYDLKVDGGTPTLAEKASNRLLPCLLDTGTRPSLEGLSYLMSNGAYPIFPPSNQTDEQLAFLLQQEEIELHLNQPLQVEALPPSNTTSRVAKSNTVSVQDVIVLDDSSEDYDEDLKWIKPPRAPQAGEEELGLLDVHELFVKYNDLYFEGKLGAVSVEWSPRMTLCAGLCTWNSGGECRIKLSSKLLQYRSNKELKETLLAR